MFNGKEKFQKQKNSRYIKIVKMHFIPIFFQLTQEKNSKYTIVIVLNFI